jgi:hypothetical protein
MVGMHNNSATALNRAIDRDLRDTERLDHLRGVLTRTLDAIMHDAERLEHPDAQWNPEDLLIDLQDHIEHIDIERNRIGSGSVVVDDE